MEKVWQIPKQLRKKQARVDLYCIAVQNAAQRYALQAILPNDARKMFKKNPPSPRLFLPFYLFRGGLRHALLAGVIFAESVSHRHPGLVRCSVARPQPSVAGAPIITVDALPSTPYRRELAVVGVRPRLGRSAGIAYREC